MDMTSKVIAGLASVVIVLVAYLYTTNLNTHDPVEMTVRIEQFGEGGGHGSGVFIEPNVVLTAQHVVEEQDTIKVTTKSGETYKGLIVKQSEDLDLAKVIVDRDGEHLNLTCKTPGVGDKLKFIGHPQKWGKWFVQWGKISSTPKDEGFWVISGNAYPGNSGGPVVNSSGELIGIINAVYAARVGLRSAQFSNYALMRSSEEICEWLNSKED